MTSLHLDVPPPTTVDDRQTSSPSSEIRSRFERVDMGQGARILAVDIGERRALGT
jgi:hypothetical protein